MQQQQSPSQPQNAPKHRDRRREGGSVMVLAALAATTLVLFAALAIDVGFVWSSRTQSQNVADAAALAAAANMVGPDVTGKLQVTGTAGDNAAIASAQNNATVANPAVAITTDTVEGCKGNCDVVYGTWNHATQTLDPPNDPGKASDRTGVRVRVRMDGNANAQSPALLAGLGGITSFDVVNTAVAYLGYEGSWNDGEFDLPLAIDECALSNNPSNGSAGAGCGGPGPCASGNPHPNDMCSLQTLQAGDAPNEFTCLKLYNTPDQNVCWTGFDEHNQNSTSTNNLRPLVGSGNPHGVGVGDLVLLDNGTKTPIVKEIDDRFRGNGNFAGQGPAGTDRYVPIDGTPDSWIVRLPVVECQDQARCASGTAFAIVGSVCFEIREVLPNPTHQINGRVLCDASPDPVIANLFHQFCGGGGSTGSGGCNFGGLRADRPVLVQ